MPPINYCKGQRGQSLAWKPAKSHQSAVRVTSVSGTPLFSLSPCSLSLFSSPPFSPSVFIVRRSRAFLQMKAPPLNPNILKFMSKYYVAGFLTQGLLKHPVFLWNHFQCRFNAHFGHEIQIFCFRKKALHILNRHGDFHCMVEIQPATSILKILEFSPSGIRLTCPTSKKQESHNLFIYSPNYQNKP